MKKYFLIIQPDNFKKPKKVERIIIFDKDKALIFDCEMTRISYMYIKKLMSENALFITYNGELLKNMLWQFFGFCEYKNIIDLMENFAVIYGKYKDWETEEGSLYIWQKLETALKYYKNRGYKIPDCKVDIYEPLEVINRTIILYDCIKDYEEKQLQEEIRKGVI